MNSYYEDESVTIYNADCRDVFPSIKAVDVMLTDPPYDAATHSKVWVRDGMDGRGRVKELGFDPMDQELMDSVTRAAANIVKRWVLIFSSLELTAEWRSSITTHDLEYIRTGIWIKENGAPQFTGDRPGVGFECVTIAHPQRNNL